MAKKWAVLPADEKNAIKNDAKKLMDEWKTDIIKWEEKMIKLGHIDVVRSRVSTSLKGKSETTLDHH